MGTGPDAKRNFGGYRVSQELCSLPGFTAKLPFQICDGGRIMVAAQSQEGLG